MTENTPALPAHMSRAWARLIKAQTQGLRSVEQALKAAGLPALSWYDVLLELERAGDAGLRPYALEKEMLLEQYNLSRLLDRIEAAGLIHRERAPDDGRGHVVIITADGLAMRKRMWTVYAPAIQAVFKYRLDADDIETLDRLLGQLITT